jgi:hypothetical protein
MDNNMQKIEIDTPRATRRRLSALGARQGLAVRCRGPRGEAPIQQMDQLDRAFRAGSGSDRPAHHSQMLAITAAPSSSTTARAPTA